MSLRVKGALIDLDGTIVDSRRAYSEALKKTYKALGLKNFNPAIALEIPRRLEQNQPLTDLIPEVNIEKFLETYLGVYYAITENETKPLPNVSKTLEELSRRLKLALLTMRHVPEENIRKELAKFGLAKYFQCVFTALDMRFPKPSPKAILECVEKLGVKISECVVVGDSIMDIRAGKNAGAKTVAVLSGIFLREELVKEKPDLILKDISELPGFLSVL